MTTKPVILSAIRQKCLDCSCYQPSEVRDCRITNCDLWPFRFGKDPEPSANRGFAKSSGYTGDFLPTTDDGLGTTALPPRQPNPPATRSILSSVTLSRAKGL